MKKMAVIKEKILAAVISFGGVWAFPRMLSIEEPWIGYTNSIVSVFLFVFLFWGINEIWKRGFEGRAVRWVLPGGFGFLFSVCMVFGAQLDGKESISFQDKEMWLGILALSVNFALLIRFLWDRMGEAGKRNEEKCTAGKGGCCKDADEICSNRMFWGSALKRAGVIFFCYFPVFLAVYPGFFVYDAQDEYLQVLTRNFSTHHPLLHVLLLGGIVHLFFKLTGSYNIGIACYTLLQMAVMSLIFAWCVEKLRCRGMGKAGRTLLTLYFGLCPVLVMFSLCSAKDGLFTGMLLIMVVLLQELWEDYGVFFRKKCSVFLLTAASLMMMLLRHNGFYGFLVFGLVSMISFCRFKNTEGGEEILNGAKDKGSGRSISFPVKPVLYFAGVTALYLLASAALAEIFHADSSENQEILTVPISQMARVYKDEKEKLPQEERMLVQRYLPEGALLKYTPKVSDGVKIQFNNEAFEEDKAGFFKLWAKWGGRHPFTYLNAWFMTSYGFWYPDTVIDVYRGNSVFTFTYGDSSYFGYEVEEPGVRESRIPWLNELYRKMSLEVFQQKIPVVSMLFSPGFLFWVTAFLLGFLCYQGRRRSVMPFLLPALCWLTVILGPTYLVRYVVFLWALLPLLLWEVFKGITIDTVSPA